MGLLIMHESLAKPVAWRGWVQGLWKEEGREFPAFAALMV